MNSSHQFIEQLRGYKRESIPELAEFFKVDIDSVFLCLFYSELGIVKFRTQNGTLRSKYLTDDMPIYRLIPHVTSLSPPLVSSIITYSSPKFDILPRIIHLLKAYPMPYPYDFTQTAISSGNFYSTRILMENGFAVSHVSAMYVTDFRIIMMLDYCLRDRILMDYEALNRMVENDDYDSVDWFLRNASLSEKQLELAFSMCDSAKMLYVFWCFDKLLPLKKNAYSPILRLLMETLSTCSPVYNDFLMLVAFTKRCAVRRLNKFKRIYREKRFNTARFLEETRTELQKLFSEHNVECV